ncbi:hypothetical protein WA026_019350 [Henosepilachna vigintioctopunctata]|uniref:Uncharacterized protein n=1 Tax=Henosepilachna vigintioctopunctata TaxID=420089 RepID=A0AAW1U1S7_9CUCU
MEKYNDEVLKNLEQIFRNMIERLRMLETEKVHIYKITPMQMGELKEVNPDLYEEFIVGDGHNTSGSVRTPSNDNQVIAEIMDGPRESFVSD